jgi:hypothetical protein
LNRRPRLRMAQFFKCLSYGYGRLCIDEEGAKFGLRCGGHYGADYLQDVENGSIILGDFVIAGHEHVAAGSTASLWFGKVGCITVNGKDHVACLVRENGPIL